MACIQDVLGAERFKVNPRMKTIGFVGTAKNTGKTTTALHMLKLVSEVGIRTALTSIGYDGENTDHVTGLPKPRYFAEPGTIIATADSCLSFGTAEYTDLQKTGLKTILGEIIITSVSKAGYVHLAGPNRRKDIQQLLERLKSSGAELTMVDGALNRLAAMTLVDGMVLSTGAAYEEKIPLLANHAAAMESLFHQPAYNKPSFSPELVTFSSDEYHRNQLPYGSVLDESSMKTVLSWLSDYSVGDCFIPGVFSPHLFEQMVTQLAEKFNGKRLIFGNPLNLLAAGFPEIWQECFRRIKSFGGEIYFSKPVKLLFLTVNPFFPKFLQKTGNYIPAFVDKSELLLSIRNAIKNTPVVDIMQPPHPDLLTLCEITH